MAEMGNGYGSEFHLLRQLGRHRGRLDAAVASLTGASSVAWLDAPMDGSRRWGDGEWKGLEFLPDGDPAALAWLRHWPARGNPPNWDAVARIGTANGSEWLLVEAKANVQELRSSCQAKEHGGRPLIEATLAGVKSALGVAADRDWLDGYYQYCNRLAALHILAGAGAAARLLFIYFYGDDGAPGRTCPVDASGWEPALRIQAEHVGLPDGHPLADRVHHLFLPVTPAAT